MQMVLLSVCFREIKTSGFRVLTDLCNFKFFILLLCFKAIYLSVLMSGVLSMKPLSLLGTCHLEQYISKSFSEESVIIIIYLFRCAYLKIYLFSPRFRSELRFHSFQLYLLFLLLHFSPFSFNKPLFSC